MTAVPPSKIDGAFVPRVADEVAWAEVDEEIVAYEELTQTVHVLGGTAAIVWGGIDGETSLDRLIDELAEAFGADHDIVRSDVLELVRGLARNRLVVPAERRGVRADGGGDTPGEASSGDRSPRFLKEPPTG